MHHSPHQSLVQTLAIVGTPSGGHQGRKAQCVHQYEVNYRNGFERGSKCWKERISTMR